MHELAPGYIQHLLRSFLNIYIFFWNVNRSSIITKFLTNSVSNYFINLTIKLFLNTAFRNSLIIFLLLIFNVVVSSARYNYLLDSNQAVLIVPNRLLSI